MAARKYTRLGETPEGFKCTNTKCKWEGTIEQKVLRKSIHGIGEDYCCPKCGGIEFRGLLKIK